MFKWIVKFGDYEAYEGDWGRDVVTKEGIQAIKLITLHDEDLNVNISPQNGVINIGGRRKVYLGINMDGYGYRLYDELLFELKELMPLTTASYNLVDRSNETLDRHLCIKYKITHYKDVFSGKMAKLGAPILKTYIIKCDKDFGIDIC